ncbi:MAG: hypothetical protein ACLUI3_16265, partial [Christensenellales bacterium]
RTPAQVRPLARRLLSMRPCADALLLLCDLPDAFSEVMPEDTPLLRALQSAVMAADARCPGHFLLLVRKRVWDDAARLYLGENQPLLPMQTVAALLAHGHAPSAFAAASFSPASLAGLSAALCPPVSPARRMFRAAWAALGESGLGRARPVPAGDDAPLSNRLPGFWNRAPRRMISSPAAVARAFPTACFASSGLFPSLKNRMGRTSARCGTFPPSWPTLPPLCAARSADAAGLDRLCRRADAAQSSFFPPRRFASFFAAVSGWEWVAVLALLEPYALRIRALPAALVRLAFLPMTARCVRLRLVWRVPRFCASAFPRRATRPPAVCARRAPAAFSPARVAPLLSFRCSGWPRRRCSAR